MKKLSKALAILLTLLLVLGVIPTTALAASTDGYAYDQPGDKDYVSNTNVLERDSANNKSTKIAVTREKANAKFTTEAITVDGVKEAAWDEALSYQIDSRFNAAMTATAPDATAQGTVRYLWDGPVLYVLVEVNGDSTQSDTKTPNWTSGVFNPNDANASDGLVVDMDVFNDQWGIETNTQGVFFLPANPNAPVTSYTGSPVTGIPSLGSFFNTNNQDYSNRLKAYKSSGYKTGSGVNYTYEFALQTEGMGDVWDRELTNGTKIGMEVGIFDQGKSFTYWSKTQLNAGNEGSSNLPNSERVRNRDWGEVTLTGWNGTDPFAYSGWRADEDIRFWNSRSNPGGSGNGTDTGNNGDGSLVWTKETKDRMIAAKNAYLAIKDTSTATRVQKETAILEVCQAFAGLRWADTKYPDPHDLTALNTLPDVYQFFDSSKGTDGKVTNSAEWEQRKQEILDLAQFYEYGYKPQLGVDYTVKVTSNSFDGTGNPTVTAQVIPTNVNFSGGIPQNVNISITLPTAGLQDGQKAPISFSGGYTANGIADITFPNWGGDSRTDAGAWGNPNRTGTFYTIFPYSRNSTSADCSIEIANATAVSAYLDILQAAVEQNPYLDAKIDPARAVTKGFSINGKLAFVAAVFDERVKAVVAGGAGATGPANWRYNAQGQEYSFTGTPYYNPGADAIVAHGTEGPGNSYRHNRVRETELFRHFLPYGHEYVHEDGSYAYGGITRLPFDQTSLVATLAPDRAIIIDTNLNDYNDGAVTDNMSLEIAKSVYKALGANGDDYVKFNSGKYVSSGDPHGVASATPEGHYLSDFFYGTHTLTGDEATWLNMDPYSLNVSNNQTENPYDYYWGGYNIITGGTGGVSGNNGWYYHTLALPPEIFINVQPAKGMDLAYGNSAGHSLSVKAENRNGSGALSYQWYSNTTNSNTGGTPIQGAVSSTFEIPSNLGIGEYYYYAVINSTSGATDCTSSVAPVKIHTPTIDTAVKSITLKAANVNYNCTLDTTTTATLVYKVEVPYGTNLNSLAPTDFTVVPHSPFATVGTPVKQNNGAVWIIPVTSDDGITTANYTVCISAPFYPVTSIAGVPEKIQAGVGLKISETWAYGSLYSLKTTLAPANASFKTITWDLKTPVSGISVTTSAGSFYGYNTTIQSVKAATTAAGVKFVLTGTVQNGASPSTNYTQDFNVEVIEPASFVPVTNITDVQSSVLGQTVTLAGTVNPDNATNKAVTWTVKASGTTAPNASITDGNILSVSGPGAVVVTVTVMDGTTMTGAAAGTSYTKDFTINFIDPDNAFVDAAVSAIESGTYKIPLANQSNQSAKTAWVQAAVTALIPSGNGSTATVTYNNGYLVSVSKGDVTKSAAITVTREVSGSSDSDEDNSSNNSNTSTNTAPTTPTTVPSNGTVEMPATLDGKTGVVKLDDTKAEDLISKNATIVVPEVAGANSYSVGIPEASLSGGKGDEKLTVSTKYGNITIPDNMLAGISGISGKEAGINIGQGNKADLPADVKTAIGDKPLIQISLSIDGKQTEWNNPNASVIVSVPYKPTAEELKNPDNIVVWYIDGNGKVVTVPNGRYDAKTGMVTFGTTHFSLYAIAYVQKSFSDLGKYAWAKQSVEVLAAKDILKTSGDVYSPAANITRVDFLYSLVRTMGVTAKTSGNFSDIGTDKYYYNEIAVAKTLGITTGIGDNKFGPDSSITRQDMMTMTERALELVKKVGNKGQTSVLNKFTDSKDISSYAAAGVAFMVNESLIVGDNNKINPKGNTTRAEAAVFLYRIYNKY
jgi:hypothetical protein